jgi:hypothetical protein
VIPRANHTPDVELDVGQLRAIDAETVANGVACIHEYDAAVYGMSTWGSAASAIATEREELARIDAAAHDEHEFDEMAFEAESELVLTLELGVGGTVEALCAAGCPTFASCRGHPAGFRGRGEEGRVPWVLFGCDRDRTSVIVQAAATANCRLHVGAEGLVTVSGPSLEELLAFGSALVVRRAVFDALAPIVAREETIPDDPTGR